MGAILIVVLAGIGFYLRRESEPELLSQSSSQVPPYQTRGAMKDDGKEWIEFPEGSGTLFYRDPTTGQWVKS